LSAAVFTLTIPTTCLITVGNCTFDMATRAMHRTGTTCFLCATNVVSELSPVGLALDLIDKPLSFSAVTLLFGSSDT